MRKKMFILVAVAVFTFALTACGTSQPSNDPTPTVEPTMEVVPTTEPTVEPIATNTPVPTATNTPLPTNTPVPTATNTPVPTATSTPTPGPTEVPAELDPIAELCPVGHTTPDECWDNQCGCRICWNPIAIWSYLTGTGKPHWYHECTGVTPSEEDIPGIYWREEYADFDYGWYGEFMVINSDGTIYRWTQRENGSEDARVSKIVKITRFDPEALEEYSGKGTFLIYTDDEYDNVIIYVAATVDYSAMAGDEFSVSFGAGSYRIDSMPEGYYVPSNVVFEGDDSSGAEPTETPKEEDTSENTVTTPDLNNAIYDSYFPDFNEGNFTAEQLMEAFFGTWDQCAALSKEGISYSTYNETTEKFEVTREIKWEYVDTVVISGLSRDDYDEERTGTAFALKFKSEENYWLVYKNHNWESGNKGVTIKVTDLDGNFVESSHYMFKNMPQEYTENMRPYRIQYIMAVIAQRDNVEEKVIVAE